MKNLFKVPFAMLLVSVLFVSCSIEENESNKSKYKQTALDSEYGSRGVQDNLFARVLEDSKITYVDEFSEYLNNLRFQQISFIEKNSNNIVFEVKSSKVMVNAKSINLSEQVLKLSKFKNVYKLTDNSSNFSVNFDATSSMWSLTLGDEIIPFSELNNEMIDEHEDIKKYPVYSGIIAEFVFKHLEVFDSSTVSGKHETVAVGFHNSVNNANYFCGKSHSEILANHPGWCSPGVSISCLWDEHLCVCTADYYSGDDCTD
ncbi:hypothetical protein ACFQ3R_12285 [Mesonia ostreae]|uniref:EGF-like domain-containing protein n=1 Tax=Mesonia ostreae TaxID=861110 RepID=A0ABU2KIK4_9FLAO|nr:hypothetical protein [Mesonia ostreae]MDT0294546.1 hypothetical protein [Mesonia ostreae]